MEGESWRGCWGGSQGEGAKGKAGCRRAQPRKPPPPLAQAGLASLPQPALFSLFFIFSPFLEGGMSKVGKAMNASPGMS